MRSVATLLVMVAAGGALGGCNSILGIDSAMVEPAEAAVEASAPPDGGAEAQGAPETGPANMQEAGDLYGLNCANYCALMDTYCGPTTVHGDNTEYLPDLMPDASGNVCPQFCALFEPTGETLNPATEPMDTNTLNCRVWHANAARIGDPHVHCAHAGPLGGDTCDDNNDDPCTSFCALDLALCSGANAAYTSKDDCLAACRPDADAGYPGFRYMLDTGNTEVTDLAPPYQSGSNTLNCRMYHLENFVRTGDATHCSHTSRSGGGVCVSLDGG